MIKHLLCTAALLLGSTALRADIFSFTYSGTGLLGSANVAGTITATATGVLGTYAVTDISGLRNNRSLSGGSGLFSYNGLLGTGGTLAFTASGGGLFGLGSAVETVTFANTGGYTEAGTTGVITASNFTISRTPEPAILLLLSIMGMGVWILARKLPSKETPLL